MMTALSDADLEGLLNFSKDIARRAGALILEGSHAIKRSQSVNQKKNAGQPPDRACSSVHRTNVFSPVS